MKKTITLHLIAIILSLLLMAVSPAPYQFLIDSSASGDGLTRLTVVNKTDAKIYLQLEGKPGYYFVIPRSTTTEFTPERGVYTYQLTACDQTTEGKMDLNIYRKLIVPVCGAKIQDYSNVHMVDLDPEFRPISLTIANGNPRTVRLKLEGPKTYNFKVGGNTTSVFSTVNGQYSYTLYACETSVEGKIDLTKYQVINVPVCGASSSGSADEHQVYISFNHLVKTNFANHTATDLVVSLKGPKNYSFYIPAGLTKAFTIFRGSYMYDYYSCKQTTKGKFEARNNAVLDLVCPQ